jgi:hypothetical protein
MEDEDGILAQTAAGSVLFAGLTAEEIEALIPDLIVS